MNSESEQMDRLADQQRQRESDRLESIAEGVSQGGAILLGVSLIALLWTFAASGIGVMFIAAGAFFLTSLALLIVGQLLYVRSALEKLRLK